MTSSPGHRSLRREEHVKSWGLLTSLQIALFVDLLKCSRAQTLKTFAVDLFGPPEDDLHPRSLAYGTSAKGTGGRGYGVCLQATIHLLLAGKPRQGKATPLGRGEARQFPSRTISGWKI